jgi:hypothetical protein
MAIVQAAFKLGISPKRFEGWEPKQITTVVEWTEDGKPLKWVTETEREWTQDERDDVLALLDYEAHLCPNGHFLPESGAHEADPANPEGEFLYQTSFPVVCFACEAVERSLKAAHKHPHLKDRNLLYATRRIERPQRRPPVESG